MLQSIPEGKTATHTGKFKVKIDANGTVHVLLPTAAAGGAGTDVEVYPDTHSDFE